MTRIEVARRIAADPASVALLLSGPAAREVWPSVADVRVGPPMRSGLGFVADMAVVEDDAPAIRGRFTVGPGPDSAGVSSVRLVLTSLGADARLLRQRGEECLDNLARVAHARSSAA